MPEVVFHFSEDPSIESFAPHVPRTNPSQRPAVWAIDEEHAPLYWFPRQCPRVTVWPLDARDTPAFRAMFGTAAHRLHVTELGWKDQMRTTVVHRYEFSAADFEPWREAAGQWISHRTVRPIRVEPVGDLLEAHARAGIDLRFVDDVWPMHDLAVTG
ncbi:MAG: hypothetical protein RJA49_1048, partial [Actinomycetota bacterium]